MPSWIPKLLKTPEAEMPACLLCGHKGPPLEAVYLEHCVHPRCKSDMLDRLRSEFGKHTQDQLRLMLTVALKERAQRIESEANATMPRLVP